MAPMLASREASIECTALEMYIRPSQGYDLSLGIQLAKVGLPGAEKNCVTQIYRHCVNLWIDC